MRPPCAVIASAAARVERENFVVFEREQGRVGALCHARQLPRLSVHTASLTRELYARAPLRRTVDDADWYFRWRSSDGLLARVVMQFRVASVELSVALEDLAPFPAAARTLHPALPPALRVAYLSGAGAAVWRELEAITRSAVELLDVCSRPAVAMPSDSIAFELRRDPQGPSIRGFVDSKNEATRQLLLGVSRREMARAPLPIDLPIQWTAIVGATVLPVADARALEAGDVVLIETASYSAQALECRLCAGTDRRRVGRVSLQHGRLQLVELAGRVDAGVSTMNSTVNEESATQAAGAAAPALEAAFGEIQVTLKFQLAQWHASLADMSRLVAGAVIDVGRPIDAATVSVWADQHCIGHGQLVAIGDRLGVRLSSAFGSGLQAQPQSASSPPGEPAAATPLPGEDTDAVCAERDE